MCLFAQVGYEEVMRLLVEGLAWARRWQGSWQVPDMSSIARARAPLGPAPLRALLVEVARPLTTRKDEGLITTIMDPERAPAAELPALYPQRWELETALDELKTHQRGPGVVLRSTDPDGVRQEVWAHLLVHYAIRTLMHQAALDADRLSFTRSLHIARRQLTSQAAFPLGGWPGRRGRRSLRRCGTCSLRAGCALCRGCSSAR
jgi:hypothetical protein